MRSLVHLILLACLCAPSCLPPQAQPVIVSPAYGGSQEPALGKIPRPYLKLPFEVGTVVDRRVTDHETIGAWSGPEGAQPITAATHELHHMVRIAFTKELSSAGVIFQIGASHRFDIDIEQLLVLKESDVSAEMKLAVHLNRNGSEIASTYVHGKAKVPVEEYAEDAVNKALSSALREALKELVASEELLAALPV